MVNPLFWLMPDDHAPEWMAFKDNCRQFRIAHLAG